MPTSLSNTLSDLKFDKGISEYIANYSGCLVSVLHTLSDTCTEEITTIYGTESSTCSHLRK